MNLQTLIRHATDAGLRVSLSPSATSEFARADLSELKDAGVERISLSVDGASRQTHDKFRGVPGTWNWTMEAISNAALAGIPIQINTTFTRQNLGEFDEFVALLQEIRPVLWSVFQLVPTGRGKVDDLLTAGNVRKDELLDVYRHSPLFRELRDPSLLKGKCGRCEFNHICGGSRARAFAMTGDPLGEEPLCVYQPQRRLMRAEPEMFSARQSPACPAPATAS
jgi:radical SAM protein with 4Fe4S-binding SPASM domain